MSAPRHPSQRPPPVTGVRSRSGPEPTESLGPLADDEWDPVGAPPELPLGTRDERPRSINTRIDSPNARVRTPPTRPPPPLPKPGERADERIGSVLGTYRLLELIGKGGMGFVYRAEHVKLGREVALKLLRADYAKRRDSVSRFFQEARTVNRVRHRNIVDVTDFIELEDGTTFIIMELLRGKSLGAWARGGFELARALAALIQICDGLAAAHAVGVIHRDLKPDNIVLVPTADGAELVKLLDFGVAKLLNREDEDVGLETAAGSVIGTPAYMSPEQAGGLAVDNRADIYSLGAIMYELFCGQPLFRGRSFGEYVRKHLNEDPTPPHQTPGGAGMDSRLEGVIIRSLAKNPDHRYRTAEELRDDLLHLLGAIETRPPDAVNVSGSGRTDGSQRHGPAPSDPGARAASLPPAGYATMMALGSELGGGHEAPRYFGRHETPHPSMSHSSPGTWTAAAPSRPRWWLPAGAAVVIGLATAGGLIAAARSPDPVSATPGAAVDPTTPNVTSMDPRPQASPKVRVRVDAPTGSTVQTTGAAGPLCTTPCTLEIDPADGGATDRREFVVRKNGYRDAAFAVDLLHPQPSVSIALEIATQEPITASHTSPTTATATTHTTRHPDPITKPDPAATKPVVAPPPDDSAAKPGSGAPTAGSGKPHRDTKVDPTATLDPFAGP
jgi:serine/threonine protein kinase